VHSLRLYKSIASIAGTAFVAWFKSVALFVRGQAGCTGLWEGTLWAGAHKVFNFSNNKDLWSIFI